MSILRKLWKSRDASTAIEYAMIGTLIAIGLVAGFRSYSNSMTNMFSTVTNESMGNGTLGP